MVSAYATRLRLTLATVAADHGGELAAAIEVPGLIALKGKIVTADALHCNRRTVAAITEGGGDYCLALKAKQDAALSDARSCFSKLSPDHPVARQEGAAHGRKETRTGTVISAEGLAEHHDFPGLRAFGRIESRRETGAIVQTETRYFALSWTPAPEVFMAIVRAHWEIENALHWQRDVSFREAVRTRVVHTLYGTWPRDQIAQRRPRDEQWQTTLKNANVRVRHIAPLPPAKCASTPD